MANVLVFPTTMILRKDINILSYQYATRKRSYLDKSTQKNVSIENII